MITHGNIVATAAAVMTVIPRMGSKDVYLAYLPLAHVFELAAEVKLNEIFFMVNDEYALSSNMCDGSPDRDANCWCCNWLWVNIDINRHIQ